MNGKKYIVTVVLIVLIIIAVFAVTKIKKDKKEDVPNPIQEIDVNEVDNVSIVDEKLAQGDYRVTQAFLLNYTNRKGSVWYRSSGIIKKIKYDGNNAIVTIKSKDSNKTIVGSIIKENLHAKQNDKVNFVGSVIIDTEEMIFSNISKDEIDYKSVVDLSLDELYQNIYNLKHTYVLVSGYLVTEGTEYKLFDSKDDYKNKSYNYFKVKWNGKFNYTGNQNVTIKCLIADRNVIHKCELE